MQDPGAPNRVTTLSNLPVPLPTELRPVVVQLLRDEAVTVRAGTAEALPYLIDWTKDADAEVATAAHAAIAAIHGKAATK